MGVTDRLKHAWNAFLKDPTPASVNTGPSFFYRPDRPRLSRGNDRSLVAAIFNRIAMDAAALDIEHVQLDEEKRYIGTVNSGLNNCLTLEANIDQTGRAFIQDVVFLMLDKGNVAIVPTDTDVNPIHTGGYDIVSMRAGEIVEWFPQYVKVRLYNEKTGQKDDQTFPKKMVSIVENPLYATINEPNSTLQRLMRKLVLIDAVDEETSSGKLNMIIQLPYIIKTDARRQQAETRRKDIEDQLRNSKYGVAYADGTEKIMQLNRPLENDLLAQIEYLTNMLYAQLGITDAVMNGTASEEEMQNYYSRTIEPILSAVTDEMKRKFLTKNARTRGQSIKYFRDPFKLITISGIAEIGDTLTRNEVLTSNELRQILGLKPSDSPRADELVNKNMPIEDLGLQNEEPLPEEMGLEMEDPQGDYDALGGELDTFDAQLDELENMLNHSDILMHRTYASPYYDPEKAHEYYMKNRELKGRSTSGLNEEGRFTAKAIREALNKERDTKIQEHRELTNKSIASSKDRMSSAIAARTAQTNTAIKANTDRTNARISSNSARTEAQTKANTAAATKKIKDNSARTISAVRANTAATNARIKANSADVASRVKANTKSTNARIASNSANTSAKVRANTKATNARVASNSERAASQIRANTQATSNQIMSNTNAANAEMRRNSEFASSQTRANTNAMTDTIDRNNRATSAQVEANTEQMNAELKAERDRVKSDIDRHSRAMTSQIEQLQSRLKDMGPDERKARRAEIQAQIDKLRDNNAEERDKLNNAYSEFSTARKAQNKETNTKLRDKNAETNKKVKTDTSEKNEKIKSETSEKNEGIRSKNAATNQNLRNENTEKNASISSKNAAENSRLKEATSEKNENLRSKSSEENAKLKEENSEKNENLRSKNSEKNEKLRSENKDKNEDIRSRNKDENEKVRTENSDKNKEARSKNSEENAKLRESNKQKNSETREKAKAENTKDREAHNEEKSKLNEEHKTKKKELKEEYDDKYDEELAKIYENPSLLKEKKEKSSGGSKGGSKGKSKGSKDSGSSPKPRTSNYKRSGSKVKAIRKKYGV